ncbi:MAG TPA: very short patch repair endonuclease [Acidobacteriota bacterium]|nr:very short patch repair endonuclease [Acidobacteriota bacterium]HQM64502.1 very short patch repair endonuclease [Acidobacteriota bacterium]
MTDVFSKEKRSWIMSRVKGRDTKPEIIVRSLVHRMGFRFRIHRRDLPGKPDIVLPRHKKIIFVHGCFWHGHKLCRYSKRPTTNKLFWNKKLEGNIERDKRFRRMLSRKGWEVLIVWQCEIQKPQTLLRKLEKFLHDKRTEKGESDRH